MTGPTIEPIHLKKGMKVTELVETYARMGFNARRLAEACQLYGRMIDEGATVGLTVSGAMAPVGMSGAFIQLMEAGFVDWVIATGANLYHDLHRAFDFPVRQGRFDSDDNELYEAGIARIYDVYIGDRATLVATDEVIVRCFQDAQLSAPISTADLHYRLGQYVEKEAVYPDKSFVVQAMRFKVPIYTSSPGDSSIGINLVVNHLRGNRVVVDPTVDVLESAAIVRASEPNGVIEVGGGSPKNFYLQTQPTLWQILNDNRGGHDFFVQITTDSPQWGGLSGATPSEARSWGKVKDAQRNNVVVYSDATVAFPLLAAYVLQTRRPRRRRELYAHKGHFLQELVDDYHRRAPHRFLDERPPSWKAATAPARRRKRR
jgi:deoxyhypusine synthase